MSGAPQHAISGDGPSEPIAVERAPLAAARRRAGLPVPPAGAPASACAAAGNVLVVAANGELRACEAALRPCAGRGAPLAAWSAGEFAVLRADAAAFRLPPAHCGRCLEWLADDLFATAPPLRDYGADPVRHEPEAPRRVVVRLDGDGALARPTLVAELEPWLGSIEELVLAGRTPFAGVGLQLLAELRAMPAPPRLALRLHEVGEVAPATTALAGLTVQSVEVVLAGADAARLAAAQSLASAVGARLGARFVCGPANWFEVEEVARLCARLGCGLDLRVLDRDGSVPLAELALADLDFVKDVFISAWSRLGGTAHPSSLRDYAFDEVCQEVRLLLRRGAETGPPADAATVALALPPVAHPWCSAPELRSWWATILLRNGHTRLVREWLLAVVGAEPKCLQTDDRAWLRALAHRVVFETQEPRLIESLRELYGNSRIARRLLAEDEAFAQAGDLQQFSGPWAERIGLLVPRRRARPFALGQPQPAPADTRADVTVLIPAYRHEDYVEEAIRSVLAQRYANFRVLVVDDGSPDGTAARARAIVDPRLEVRVNGGNLGLGNSVLQALESIDTPYVALLNSDDLLHPDHLARCRAVLEQDPVAQLVATDLFLVDQRGGRLTAANTSLVLDGKQVFEWVRWFDRSTPPVTVTVEQQFGELLQRNYLATSSNMVVRTPWLRAQAASLRSLKYCLDWRLFLEAALQHVLVHLRLPLVAYRLHASNTVWFEPDRRFRYYLELNRVVAEVIERYAAQPGVVDQSSIERVLAVMVEHVAGNTEVHGHALFLNAVLDPLQLDRAAATSPTAQVALRRLSDLADRLRLGQGGGEASGGHAAARERLLGQLGRDLAQVERGHRRWLQGAVDGLEQQLRSAEARNAALAANAAALGQAQAALEAQLQQQATAAAQAASALAAARSELGELQQRHQQQTEQLQAGRLAIESLEHTRAQQAEQLTVAAAQIATLQQRAGELEAAGAMLRADLAALAARHTELQADLARVRAELAALDRERTALEARLAAAHAEIAALTGQRDDLTQQRDDLTQQRDDLTQQRDDLTRQRDELRFRTAGLEGELDQLRHGREFRTGNFLWNKLPFGYLSRRAKKWYRRLLDALDRTTLSTARALRRREGPLVVASCRQWPIYHHTFVYQEMLGLADAGFDVRLFHWDAGDRVRPGEWLHRLDRRRTRLQTVWEIHRRDLRHFERRRPGRLQAFLERVAAATGRSVAELRSAPEVLQACTFARMAELAGARYLHSYFFYDQSFMAMQAAWLLDLPRGVSCYADHMLDDYPLKLVPLQLELADVVVATSARIRRELSARSDGRHDRKILVKPNGVDGTRFPAIDRGPRQAGAPFELVAVARIDPKKGLVYLVEAVAVLKQQGRAVVAHVVGGCDPKDTTGRVCLAELQRRIAELSLQHEIVLHGARRQEEIAPLLRRCRAFVAPYVELPSGDKDGIPTALLEALASRLPVVATDAGSIREAIDDGVEGLLTPQRDPAALAAAIGRLIDEPALEDRLAAAARARFDREFDVAVTERRLHERIAQVLADRRAGAAAR